MDLQGVGWGMDWLDLAQGKNRLRALLEAVMKLWFPQNEGNIWSS